MENIASKEIGYIIIFLLGGILIRYLRMIRRPYHSIRVETNQFGESDSKALFMNWDRWFIYANVGTGCAIMPLVQHPMLKLGASANLVFSLLLIVAHYNFYPLSNWFIKSMALIGIAFIIGYVHELAQTVSIKHFQTISITFSVGAVLTNFIHYGIDTPDQRKSDDN